jgi:hypothetical protein
LVALKNVGQRYVFLLLERWFSSVTIQPAPILSQKGRFSAILRLFSQPMRCIAFKKQA